MMRPFVHRADSAKLATLARQYPDLVVSEHRRPVRGMFSLHFNNKKKQLGGYQSHDCEGVLFSDGKTYLNTNALLQREFYSFTEMKDYLEDYGDCVINWLDEVK